MSRQFIYIPIPNPLPPQKDILDKIFRQSLHMYQSLHILVSNVLVWVSKYNVCNSAVFSGFSPQTPFFIAFLHSYSSWTAPISKSPRTSRHATTWLYTCVGIPPAFNCWSKFQPSHLWGGGNYIFLPVWKFGSKSLRGKGLVLNIRQFLQRKPGIQCCGYNSLSLTWIL